MKIKFSHIFFILLLAGLIVSCHKKKYPESVVENNAVYGFTALIDNQPVTIAAGINNYYMYSSYTQDSNYVYNFIGELKSLNCTDCRNSLKIQINDFISSALSAPVNPINIDTLFRPSRLGFLKGRIDGYTVQFNASFNKTAIYYLWDFGDGTTSSGSGGASHLYTRSGLYDVKLKIRSNDGCESIIHQTKEINTSSNTLAANISTTSLLGDSIQFTQTVSGGRPPYNYVWNFGDGAVSSQLNPVHFYRYRGGYPVSLRVTDANNKVVVAEYNAVTENDNSSCAANYFLSPITKLIDNGLSKVIVSWTDANGVVYTSNNDLQPGNSNFIITSVAEGGLNENNLTTKKLHVTFNCTVYNGSNSLSIRNAEATITIAY